MSLSGDDKTLLTRLYLEKSHMYMEDSERLIALGSLSSAANRLYYAVFHAVHALFVANGITSKSHHGTNTQFHQHFVKTGMFEPRFGRYIATLEVLREKADYNVMYNVSRSELEAMKPTAEELIKQIENVLNNQN